MPISYGSGEMQHIDLPAASQREYNDFAPQVIANFIDAIEHGSAPLIPARDVINSIDLIDDCYAQATPFDLPWYDVEGTL